MDVITDVSLSPLSLAHHHSISLFSYTSRRVTCRLVNVKGKRTVRIATTSFQNGFFFFYSSPAEKKLVKKVFFFLNWTGKYRDSRVCHCHLSARNVNATEDTNFARFNDSFIRASAIFASPPPSQTRRVPCLLWIVRRFGRLLYNIVYTYCCSGAKHCKTDNIRLERP